MQKHVNISISMFYRDTSEKKNIPLNRTNRNKFWSRAEVSPLGKVSPMGQTKIEIWVPTALTLNFIESITDRNLFRHIILLCFCFSPVWNLLNCSAMTNITCFRSRFRDWTWSTLLIALQRKIGSPFRFIFGGSPKIGFSP